MVIGTYYGWSRCARLTQKSISFSGGSPRLLILILFYTKNSGVDCLWVVCFFSKPNELLWYDFFSLPSFLKTTAKLAHNLFFSQNAMTNSPWREALGETIKLDISTVLLLHTLLLLYLSKITWTTRHELCAASRKSHLRGYDCFSPSLSLKTGAKLAHDLFSQKPKQQRLYLEPLCSVYHNNKASLHLWLFAYSSSIYQKFHLMTTHESCASSRKMTKTNPWLLPRPSLESPAR
jgi:hypothetical protein